MTWQVIATICMLNNPAEPCLIEHYGAAFTFDRAECEAYRAMLVAPEHWYEPGYPEHVEGSTMELKCEQR
jgi:hypothetical protein